MRLAKTGRWATTGYVRLCISTIKKLEVSKGHGTLVIPEWPSRLFWTYLHHSGVTFKPYVKEQMVLPMLSNLITEGPGQITMYGKLRRMASPSLIC